MKTFSVFQDGKTFYMTDQETGVTYPVTMEGYVKDDYDTHGATLARTAFSFIFDIHNLFWEGEEICNCEEGFCLLHDFQP